MAEITKGSQLSRSMNSFSGVDIRAHFGTQEIAELQAVSYSVTREKAPIYVMGRADPLAFSRGKRGIAGSLIFVNFQQHAVLANLGGNTFSADSDEMRPSWSTSTAVPSTESAATADANITTAGAGIARDDWDQVTVRPWYADQIPPFDVTLVGANEYGAVATMKIIGIDLLNEGYGVSIDDVVSEMQYTYVCRMIIPWVLVKSPGGTTLSIAGGRLGSAVGTPLGG